MIRAAIYARFSSDLQRDRSIEDQISLCRASASKDDAEVVAIYEDRAKSSASIFGRDGLLTMMEAARGGQFDVVIVEALDRLSRDQEDLAGIYKRLSFAGVEIRAVHDGKADQVQIGIRGLVGALFMQDLAHKVRRGMAGVISDGRHAGGRAYGYRSKLGSPGEMEIDEAEAAVVHRIFSEYVAGRTPREIAIGLNADRVAPPRGDAWMASTINGNAKRGYGIILNPIYRGRIVWNRVRMVKDPETGRRVSRVNPESAWKTSDAPHLRIIDEDLASRALALKGKKSDMRPEQAKKPKHLLSGLLKCGTCGRGLSVKDRSSGRVRIHCTMAKEAGLCENRRTYYLDMIEPAVTGGLREKLADRRAIAVYINAYNEERQRLAAGAIERRAKAEVRLTTVKRQIARITSLLIEEAMTIPDGKAALAPLRLEHAEIEAELERIEPAPKIVSLHPATVADYLATIERLDVAIQQGDERAFEAVKAAIRDLVDKVVVRHAEDGALDIEVVGHLANLIGGEAFPQMKLGGPMVAGEGLEPPTRGL